MSTIGPVYYVHHFRWDSWKLHGYPQLPGLAFLSFEDAVEAARQLARTVQANYANAAIELFELEDAPLRKFCIDIRNPRNVMLGGDSVEVRSLQLQVPARDEAPVKALADLQHSRLRKQYEALTLQQLVDANKDLAESYGMLLYLKDDKILLRDAQQKSAAMVVSPVLLEAGSAMFWELIQGLESARRRGHAEGELEARRRLANALDVAPEHLPLK